MFASKFETRCILRFTSNWASRDNRRCNLNRRESLTILFELGKQKMLSHRRYVQLMCLSVTFWVLISKIDEFLSDAHIRLHSLIKLPNISSLHTCTLRCRTCIVKLKSLNPEKKQYDITKLKERLGIRFQNLSIITLILGDFSVNVFQEVWKSNKVQGKWLAIVSARKEKSFFTHTSCSTTAVSCIISRRQYLKCALIDTLGH